MTSTPDQPPAATEAAKVPDTDPVEQAPTVASEQDSAADNAEPQSTDVAETSAADAGADVADEPAADAAPGAADSPDPAEPDTAPDAAEAEPEPVESEPAVAADEPESVAPESAAPGSPAPGEAAAESATGSELPVRSKRHEAPTEEFSIVPAPAAPPVESPAALLASPTEPSPPAADAASEAVSEDRTEAELDRTTTADQATGADGAATDDDDAAPRTSAPASATATTPPTASGTEAVPAAEETFDFKALSFAAITAAHKKSLGPRTVAGDTDADTDAPEENTPQEHEPAAAEDSPAVSMDTPGEPETPAENVPTSPDAETPAVVEPPALFVPPTLRTAPAAMPPSPFPMQTAPPQHRPSPFPTPRGGASPSLPAVHGYAPEASYAGWRPPTEADHAARRRRFALIGGATAAVVAAIVVVAVVVNMANRQQWEPIEAMIAEPREVQSLQLVLGSCVETIPADGEVAEVLAVPCDVEHTAQVVGRTDFADAAVWPGRDDVDKRVALVCGTKQLGPIARTSQVANSVSYVVWGPSEESWDDGDRVGLCLATTGDPITRDLLQ